MVPGLGPEAREEEAAVEVVVAAADIVVEEGVADSSSADPAVVALADAEKEVGLPDKHPLHWGQQEQEPGFPPSGELQRDQTTLAW